ncbi:MAG: hypothetical protein [Microvirus sp.]|nr:MAG: hypothetical protein [Microvirus sp.]
MPRRKSQSTPSRNLASSQLNGFVSDDFRNSQNSTSRRLSSLSRREVLNTLRDIDNERVRHRQAVLSSPFRSVLGAVNGFTPPGLVSTVPSPVSASVLRADFKRLASVAPGVSSVSGSLARTLSPQVVSIPDEDLRRARICLEREERREVLFASGVAGKGGSKRPPSYDADSSVRC